jgi:ABC-type sugar transport system permease subunit
MSFTNWRILGDPQWVGLDNFKNMFQDKMFWQAFVTHLALPA